MAELAVGCPLLVAHLANDRGIRPDMLAALRQVPRRRRRIASLRVEPSTEIFELSIVEPRPHAPRVAVPLSVPDGQVERAEADPPALRLGVADDDEVVRAMEANLDPVGASPAP